MGREGNVTITIKYLVNLSDKAGRSEETAVFPINSTLNDLAGYLKESRNIILPGHGIIAVLNGKGWNQYPDKWNTTINDGDTILLFPLLSGG
jgi:molybdopterin converting factor small subunit